MHKTGKNLLLIFTMVCVIALAIFSVELILLNRDTSGSGRAASEEASSPDEENTDPEPGDPEDGASGDESTDTPPPPSETDPPEDTQNIPRTGTRHEMLLPDEKTLVLYADPGLFEYLEGELDWLFVYRGGGDASLEIGFGFIAPPGGMSTYAENFLIPYLDGGESTVVGEGRIRRSQITGVEITGENNGMEFRAWVHSLTGSNDEGLALIFVINHTNDEQRDALYAILDTIELQAPTPGD